jgi:hypothetical protein
MSVEINFAFPSGYEAELLFELPPDMMRFYYPGADRESGKDGLALKISPQSAGQWVGIFAFGYPSPQVKSGIYSCPDERTLCVVAQGRGYLVRTDDPTTWEQIRAYPIINVHPVSRNNLIVFADFTRLTAYGPAGLLWQTDELSWDSVKISKVADDLIHGFGWDAPAGKYVPFTVVLQTGHHEGGASPVSS